VPAALLSEAASAGALAAPVPVGNVSHTVLFNNGWRGTNWCRRNLEIRRLLLRFDLLPWAPGTRSKAPWP